MKITVFWDDGRITCYRGMTREHIKNLRDIPIINKIRID